MNDETTDAGGRFVRRAAQGTNHAPSLGAPFVESSNARHWAELIRDVYGGVDVVARTEDPFEGRLARRTLDRLETVELRTSAQEYTRTQSMVARQPSDDLFVTLIAQGEALVVQGNHTSTLSAGDFVFVESSRPYTVAVGSSTRLIDFSWPRDGIGLAESECRAITARAFRASSPLGRWLSPALLGLHDMDEGVSRAGVARIADGIADLLITAALELGTPEDVHAQWRGQYDEMLRFIERNLDDPDLSAETLVAHFFMSSRSVHRIFARFGSTPTVRIREARLERARQMMIARAHRTKSVSFIASQAGFSSLQVFSRTFTAKYGVGPRQYRADHL
ncbi:helix-turn-helix domain-containing protein [Aeromicrobium yanjiei]|uniref:Helix-turn-helix domain-containing protein n=1 Tax=Aeromicrobium yanjiei TaxID=2662028 RepID=A0A5Q2MFT0_9ACTN|nr:helix-turn-helix domain-containing protein [Aeromicrobium yanjiei]QGG40569.1 helix-turn-helix domain-containing protein [Aeromicrobium yanjiei]